MEAVSHADRENLNNGIDEMQEITQPVSEPAAKSGAFSTGSKYKFLLTLSQIKSKC